jgi:predicted outer membrane repeat protein
MFNCDREVMVMKTIETIHKDLHRSSTLAWSLAVLACWCSPSLAAEIHVPGDVPTIQGAINSAQPGDVVVVACGTYVEALQLRSDVALRSATGIPDCVTIEVAAGTVAFTADHDQDVVIEGLRITSSASLARGLVAEASSVALRRCELVGLHTQSTGNFQPGGAAALLQDGSTLDVEECLFEDNQHNGVGNVGGGAIRCESSNLFVRSSTFIRNVAIANGGAISANQSGIAKTIVEVTGSTFRENRAVFGGGGSLGDGGAIYLNEIDAGGLLVDECVFEGNSSGNLGGAILTSRLEMENSRFLGNWASEGGAVWSFQGIIANCEFLENAAYVGTALRLTAYMNVHGTLFARNHSLEGAADGTVRCRGGGFENCTFVENQVGGSPTSAEIKSSDYGLYILNTIIAFGIGSTPVDIDSGVLVEVTCCDFYGNSWGDWVGDVAGLNGVAGNISADPLFCDLAAQDYTLQSSSPCAPMNSGGCGLIGALDVGCGTVSVESKSWGQIKGLYR